MSEETMRRIADALETIAKNTVHMKDPRPKAPEQKSSCKYCGAEIYWAKYGKKSFPVDAEGNRHQCKEYAEAKKTEGGQK